MIRFVKRRKNDSFEYGYYEYFFFGFVLHRLDGPAVEYKDGEKWWYLNGKLHRENGPAVECIGGYKSWYLNGIRHREDGPAVEYNNGNKYWYLNGNQYSEQDFKKELIKFKLKRIENL